jgi:predicted ester cyclase
MEQDTKRNEELIRRWFEELVDHRNLAALETFCGKVFYDHNPLGGATEGGVAAAREGFERLHRGMPDIRVEMGDVLAVGDRVFVRTVFFGKHEGDLMGLNATGKPLRMEVWHLFRLADGAVVEHRAQSDLLAVLRQVAASSKNMADVILIPPRDVPSALA